MGIIMSWQEFIKPELLILIPVLYFVGVAIKKSPIKDTLIPYILGGTGVLLTFIYLMASEPVQSTQEVFTAIFTALTQGILCAAASVYANQLYKQAVIAKEEHEKEIKEKEEK